MENQNNKVIIETGAGNQVPKNPQNFLARLKITPAKIKKVLMIFLVLGVIIGVYYWFTISQRVYSDKAEIFAPLITLSAEQPGVLQKILVKEGDKIRLNQAVAKLDQGGFVIAKQDGIAVKLNNQVGKLFSPGEPIVTMINPEDLRLIVHVAENKGLNSVNIGQRVIFTVDAFDSKEFYGTVEEISQTSDQSSVVFSISDKRDEKNFSIKVKYGNYPELLNGMSAKAWIYK
ncbi:MAG: efflux RND transporter periplasmic adaptor subunit [Patescibacteria group bacterium]|jgi:multidrug resistance efflux pump